MSVRRSGPNLDLRVLGVQLAIVVVFLAVWEWVPDIPAVQTAAPVFDHFVISSPSRVAVEIWQLATGANNTAVVWPYLATTLAATLVGTAVGLVIGGGVGLVLSNNEVLMRILAPFITLVNAAPRIALIPIVVIIFGPTTSSTAVTAFLLVFFLVFFNALEGGRSIPPHVIHNAGILGADPLAIMRDVRLPYVVAWTFAALPNAISFGLVGVVTAELLTGVAGMGRLLVEALFAVQGTKTFAVVIILAFAGLLLVSGATALRVRVLHWWEQGGFGA